MVANIALIGAGNIGRRHLQALALLEREVLIQVVDPQPTCLQLARDAWNSLHSSDKNNLKIEFLSSSKQLKDTIDVAIVATNADVRRAVIEDLLNQKRVRYVILEKVLFQAIEDYEKVGTLLREKQVQAWVNCPRRMFPFYQQLKTLLTDTNNIDFYVSGAKWGLGCNGVHFLDLFAYLTGQSKLELTADLLDEAIQQSKRPGFIEVTGSLSGITAEGSRLAICSYLQGQAPVQIHINSSRIRCLISETGGQGSIAQIASEHSNWQWEEQRFQVMYQSQLSHLAVSQLLDNGKCELTNYDESTKLHIPFLKAINKHLQKSGMEVSELCPIT